ncbi:MAG: STAS domain-containing protein [Alphaproteobacteria bacterium]|nr:STAS domain-containing protein [Alphaproteobacteria bacterium]
MIEKGGSLMSGLQSELVDDVCQITLPRVLDIPAASDLRDTVLEMVDSEMTVTLRSDEVEQVTTPGIQVLLAVAAHVERKKARLTVAKPSEALVDGFSDLGLFSQLMAWNVE